MTTFFDNMETYQLESIQDRQVFEQIQQDTEIATHVAIQLESLSEVILSSTDTGTNPINLRLANIAYNSLAKQVGASTEKYTFTLESLEDSQKTAITYVGEEAKGLAGRVWESIVKAWKWLIEKLKDLFFNARKFFTSAKHRLKKLNESIKSDHEVIKVKVDGSVVVKSPLAKYLTSFNPSTGKISKCTVEEAFKELDEAINWVSDSSPYVSADIIRSIANGLAELLTGYEPDKEAIAKKVVNYYKQLVDLTFKGDDLTKALKELQHLTITYSLADHSLNQFDLNEKIEYVAKGKHLPGGYFVWGCFIEDNKNEYFGTISAHGEYSNTSKLLHDQQTVNIVSPSELIEQNNQVIKYIERLEKHFEQADKSVPKLKNIVKEVEWLAKGTHAKANIAKSSISDNKGSVSVLTTEFFAKDFMRQAISLINFPDRYILGYANSFVKAVSDHNEVVMRYYREVKK